MKTFREFAVNEDEGGAPTNCAGSGNIAGIGVAKAGDPSFSEPGVPVKKKKKKSSNPILFSNMFLRIPK